MKTLFLAIVFLAGSLVLAQAQEPSLEVAKVVEELQASGLIKQKEVSVVLSAIQGLVDAGVVLSDARGVIVDAATQARVQGLEGEAFKVKVAEAAAALTDQFKAEGMTAGDAVAAVEHPATTKPKDHPAH